MQIVARGTDWRLVLLLAVVLFGSGFVTATLVGRGALEDVRDQLRAGTEQLDSTLSELDRAKAAIVQLEADLDTSRSEVARLVGEANALRTESERLRKEISDSRRISGELTDEIGTAGSGATALAGSVGSSGGFGAAVEKLGNERQRIIAELRRRCVCR